MPYISLKNVTYTYPGRDEPAVNDVSLDIFNSEKTALTGLNGSGKSTLAKLMTRLLKKQQGNIYLENRSIESYSLSEIGRRVGYIYQNPNEMLFSASVYGEIAFGLTWQGKSKSEIDSECEKHLRYFGLEDIRDNFPFNLSDGQKQLVVLIAVLVLKPKMLILDEPTRSLDSHKKILLQAVLQDIWSQGTGIVIISHDNEFVRGFQGRNVHMAKGEVLQ